MMLRRQLYNRPQKFQGSGHDAAGADPGVLDSCRPVIRGLPIVRYTIIHKREAELHYDLRQMRDAIDRYKDLADRNLIRMEVGSEGYPPDLETLVKGVQLGAGNDRKIRFLRKIPKDPMTGQTEWGLLCRSGRSRLDQLGRQERVRRTLEVSGDRQRRHAVFGLVDEFRIRGCNKVHR